MILLLLLLFPFLEMYGIYKVSTMVGGWSTLGALIVSAALGSMIAKAQGRTMWLAMQSQLQQRQAPAASLLHGVLIWLGAFLLMVPGFLSDGIGVLCILPGSRHLLAFWLRGYLARQVARGSVHVFSNISPDFGRPRPMRDVSPHNIVDVPSERLSSSRSDSQDPL